MLPEIKCKLLFLGGRSKLSFFCAFSGFLCRDLVQREPNFSIDAMRYDKRVDICDPKVSNENMQ